MKKIYACINRYASGHNILSGLALIVLCNLLLGLIPLWNGQSQAFAKGQLPDLWYNYSATDLQKTIAQWGPDARNTYMINALLVDNCYALIYGLTYLFLLWWLYQKAFPQSFRLWRPVLVMFTILPSLMDWVENFSIFRLVRRYPQTGIAAEVAPWATWLKWNSAMLVFLLLLIGLFKLLLMRIYSEQKPNTP